MGFLYIKQQIYQMLSSDLGSMQAVRPVPKYLSLLDPYGVLSLCSNLLTLVPLNAMWIEYQRPAGLS